MSEEEFSIASQNDYLESGIHIATKVKTPGTKKFIYKVREDGLYLFDLKTIDERIKVAASMLSKYDPKKIVVTASRIYAVAAAQKFSEIINANFIKGRVTPGIFTNPYRDNFMEPAVLFASDTRNEKQAVREASEIGVPIIALCDTDNMTRDVDLVIPCNNRGRKSLAFVYMLLAREFLKNKGIIKTNEEFKYTINDFELKVEANPADSEINISSENI
ncbi:30S ribosomal protein S2p [Candidatus Mancarchaeum acidiphilum]|uniref:Small ribosomal subunit protein uS2 n=1 Tax=Candidatus Mancarchaeum acidiphilum TaxID=1920749 RepID=A0A218NLL3_9ARCH|nr:30S ribosomal protein S2 [Candidatus Mancarchaeum acidiphilum]ASI13365.1 30S ribosomal protein S2p [Candidatus Mancarchaeum acidiphilum]